MNPRKSLLLLGVPLVLAAVQAHAIPIVGNSYGSFNELGSCDTSGSNANCRIVDSSQGSNTQVQWGSTTSSGDGFYNPSKLTSVDVSFNVDTDSLDPATDGNDVVLARLDWYNNATTYDSELLSFDVDWFLKLEFSQPTGSLDPYAEEEFDLTILNPVNPTGDTMQGLSLANLQGLELNLNGITISDLKYCINGINNCFQNGSWYNPEKNTSKLYITADFKPRSVPEPGTLALFGLGLLGVGFAVRRRGAVK